MYYSKVCWAFFVSVDNTLSGSFPVLCLFVYSLGIVAVRTSLDLARIRIFMIHIIQDNIFGVLSLWDAFSWSRAWLFESCSNAEQLGLHLPKAVSRLVFISKTFWAVGHHTCYPSQLGWGADIRYASSKVDATFCRRSLTSKVNPYAGAPTGFENVIWPSYFPTLPGQAR